MGVIPQTVLGKIEFFEAHLPIWAQDPVSIGLTAPQIVALSTLVDAARAAYEAAQVLRDNARSGTLDQNLAVGAMFDLGADFVKTIRAFAQTNNDPSVYVAANIPAPAPNTPLGPPQTPKELTATLNTAGQITLKWGGTRAGGTSYAIERSTAGAGGPWSLIGTSEERAFTDSAVPRGHDFVSYRVTASRSGGSSAPSAAVAVLFGTVGGESSSGEGLSLAA